MTETQAQYDCKHCHFGVGSINKPVESAESEHDYRPSRAGIWFEGGKQVALTIGTVSNGVPLKDSTLIPINYCPWCGRKLVNANENE